MKNKTGHAIVMGQLQMMQIAGRKGDNVSAREFLDSAKRIWEELQDVDETIKANLEYYKKNYAHFSKMVEC